MHIIIQLDEHKHITNQYKSIHTNTIQYNQYNYAQIK